MFKDCLKLGFKCSNIISDLSEKVSDLELENKQLKQMLATYEHYALKYKDLPTMDEMIKDGRAKRFDQEQFRAQWKKQFGLILSWGTSPTNWGKTVTEWHRMDSTGVYPLWRVPKAFFQEFVKRSPVDLWSYNKDASMGDTSDQRSYMCVRFSLSMLGERYLSPYYDMVFGMVWYTGHSVNMCWFSDDDRIYYFEPQGDGLRAANEGKFATSYALPRELWL